MRAHMWLIAVVLVASLATRAVGDSDPVPSGKVLAYGLFKVVTEEKTEKAPDTTSGVKTTTERAFVSEQTEKIPAKKGIRFGIEYSLTGLPKGEEVVIRKVLVHPLIKTPDGKEKKGYTVDLKRQTTKEGAYSGFTGYGFDHDYELVPGNWKIELWYKDKKLAEQEFKVYAPEK